MKSNTKRKAVTSIAGKDGAMNPSGVIERFNAEEGEYLTKHGKKLLGKNWKKHVGVHSQLERLYRQMQALTLRAFRAYYGRHLPIEERRKIINAMRAVMSRAERDCSDLDRACAAYGIRPTYRTKLDFTTEGAFYSLEALALKQLKKESQRTITLSRDIVDDDDIEKGVEKEVLHILREKIRDGSPPELALRIVGVVLGDVVTRAAEYGSVGFFIELGKALQETVPGKRGLTSWLERTWLPLRLWDCPADGRKAHNRFCRAWKLQGREEPPWDKFITAWKNVRGGTLKKSIRSSSRVKKQAIRG